MQIKALLAKFKDDESGATAIEYGLIAALIAVVLIAGATMVGDKLNLLFEGISKELTIVTPDGV